MSEPGESGEAMANQTARLDTRELSIKLHAPVRRVARAVTIVEVLVVLGVVAVLVAIVSGGLAESRSAARSARTLASLASHAQVFALYAGDYQESFPFFTDPARTDLVLSAGGVRVAPVKYFDAHNTWHLALAARYYDQSARSRVFAPWWVQESDTTDWPRRTSFEYPCVFLAADRYWNAFTRTGPEQWGATKVSSVVFPSAKSALVEAGRPRERLDVDAPRAWYDRRAAFVDGSAALVPFARQGVGYERGDGFQFYFQGAVHFGEWPLLLHTQEGIAGRDVR